MRHNFISTISLQSVNGLKKTVYYTEDERIKYNDEILDANGEKGVYFPILQSMANIEAKNDKIVFTTIITQNSENAKNNYETYKQNVKTLFAKKNITITDEAFREIKLAGKDSLREQIGLFDDIINSIEPGDLIYGCMTYGNKPNIATLNMAVEYAIKCIDDVSVKSIVYGRYPHAGESRNAEIYDYASLVYMNSLVNQMAQMKVKNPAEKIIGLLGIEK